MATIGSASHASLNNVPRRSYITMSTYTNDFFSYNLALNNQSLTYVGTLSPMGVPVTSTVQGSILSETGKKLYPGANDGVSTLMVSVYDQTSKMTGFINPNSPTFAVFTTDKPPYMGQGTDPGSDGRTNLGNSIYTHGSVIADGFGTYAGLLSTGTSATIGSTLSVRQSISTGTSITAGTYIAGKSLTSPAYYTGYASTIYNNAAGSNSCDMFVNPSAGTFTTINLSSGYTQLGVGAGAGPVNVYINNTLRGDVVYGPPAGEAFQAMIINGTGRALSTVIGGTNVKGNNFGLPNNARALLSFVADGTRAYETSGIIVPA